jgi:hypothetical protein
MRLQIGNANLFWNEPSGWKCRGGGRSIAGGLGVAIPTPLVLVNVGAGFGGTAWEFDLESTNVPRAFTPQLGGGLSWDGYYLPEWNRFYRFKVVGVTGSIGASTIGDVLVDATVSYGEGSDPSGSIGSVLRQLGAPVPADQQHNYEAGDPYGFLGIGLQSTGSAAITNVRGMTGSLSYLSMGSNIVEVLRGRTPSWVSDNLGHIGSLLGHVVFKYSTLHWGRGSDTFQVGAINASVSYELQFCYLALMDLFIVEPGTNYTYYVYSMWLDEDNRPVRGQRQHNYPREWVKTVGNSGPVP